MSKKTISRFLASGVAVALVTGSIFTVCTATAAPKEPSTTASFAGASVQGIDQAKAEALALSHAGLTQSQVDWLYTDRDFDHGRLIFDVDFSASGGVYSYEIDGATGNILDVDYDQKYFFPYTNRAASVQTNPGTSQAVLEQAKTAALARAGVSAEAASFIWAGQDWDDGRFVYALKFVAGNNEYYCQADATTGELVLYSQEAHWRGRPNTVPNTADIGAEEAKKKALAAAGITEADVAFLYIVPDGWPGRRTYEVNFYAGGKDCDYEIDAATGEIRSIDEEVKQLLNPPGQSGYLTEAQVKGIVEQMAGAGGVYTKFQMDMDHGYVVYEGELQNRWTEYEFTIDAATGAVFEWDADED